MLIAELTEEQRAAAPCYVGRCKTCNGILAAMVYDAAPDRVKEAAKEIAKWVRGGLSIGETPVSEVRTGKWCDCKRKKK